MKNVLDNPNTKALAFFARFGEEAAIKYLAQTKQLQEDHEAGTCERGHQNCALYSGGPCAQNMAMHVRMKQRRKS